MRAWLNDVIKIAVGILLGVILLIIFANTFEYMIYPGVMTLMDWLVAGAFFGDAD